jgi:uncharacterized protein DUF559
MYALPPGLHGAHRVRDLRRQLGRYQLEALLRDGLLIPYSRHVVVVRGCQLDLRTRAAAALLLAGPRAVLTSHTAAFLHGCTAASGGRIHLLVDYQRRLSNLPDVAVHQGLYDEQDVMVLDGLRVMALEHAVAELLCRAPRRDALACLDQALASLSPELRDEFRAEVGHRIASRRDPRGRRRSQVLLALGSGLAESPAESWLMLSLFDAGFPVPTPQFPVLDMSGREIYRLDLAWEEPLVALEYDGYAAHVDRVGRDAARDEDLRRRGWTVIRATADDLKDPARLHVEIRRVFSQRRFAA